MPFRAAADLVDCTANSAALIADKMTQASTNASTWAPWTFCPSFVTTNASVAGPFVLGDTKPYNYT
jgi:hypothetical protein